MVPDVVSGLCIYVDLACRVGIYTSNHFIWNIVTRQREPARQPGLHREASAGGRPDHPDPWSPMAECPQSTFHESPVPHLSRRPTRTRPASYPPSVFKLFQTCHRHKPMLSGLLQSVIFTFLSCGFSVDTAGYRPCYKEEAVGFCPRFPSMLA